MIERKILIVTSSFYPMNAPRSFRATELAKEFSKQGHDVTILTHRVEEHFDFETKTQIRIKDLGKIKWKLIPLKGKGVILLLKRGINRFGKLFFEFPDIELMWLVNKALRKESGYDLLISIAVPYPIHWGVASIWNKRDPIAKVWGADCGDPYMGRENDTFKVPFYFKFIEKWFCGKADYITVPTEGAIQGYYPEFHKKIRVIPQGFRFDNIALSGITSKKNIPVFCYAGAFIPGRRDPSEFINFLENYSGDFEFWIYTNTPQFVKINEKKSGGRIRLMPVLPRLELLSKLSTMNFVINFENTGNRQTPSKLIDYVIIKKPILSIKTGALNEKTIVDFLNGNYNDAYIVKDPDQFRIENVAKKFLDLLDQK